MNIILIRFLAISMFFQQSMDYIVARDLMIFLNSISDDLLKRNAQWTNEWFQVKTVTEPNEHQGPKTYQICYTASW